MMELLLLSSVPERWGLKFVNICGCHLENNLAKKMMYNRKFCGRTTMAEAGY